MSNRKAKLARSGEPADRLGLGSTAVRAEPDGPCDVAAYMGSYVPRGESWRSTPSAPRDFSDWERIAEFVRTAVVRYADAKGPMSRFTTQALARTTAELALLASEQGTALSASAVLTHWTIEQFDRALTEALREQLKAHAATDRKLAEAAGTSTNANRVAYARRVARALNPRGGWPATVTRRHRCISLPYSTAELRSLEDQISRNTGLARRNGEGFLVLGLGAGLDGRWAARVRSQHVEDLGADGLVTHVPGRAVPVLRDYEERLRALLELTPEGGFVYGGVGTHKNAASAAVSRIRLDPAGPQLELGRLRSTWLLTHLTLGTRVPELMAAAGLVSMTPLSDMAEFVPPLDPDPARCAVVSRAMVRGAVTGTR